MTAGDSGRVRVLDSGSARGGAADEGGCGKREAPGMGDASKGYAARGGVSSARVCSEGRGGAGRDDRLEREATLGIAPGKYIYIYIYIGGGLGD